MESINLFDIVIIVLMGYAIIRGIFRGFIREIAGIIGLLAGFYIAYGYYGHLSPFLERWISNPAYRDITAFIIVFCTIALLIIGLGVLVRLIVRMLLLGVVDRIFGAVFGAVKGALIVSVLLVVLVNFLPARGAAMIAESRLAPAVHAVSREMVRLIPESARQSFTERMAAIRKEWKQRT
jgi:membrane protein required for colicin V production